LRQALPINCDHGALQEEFAAGAKDLAALEEKARHGQQIGAFPKRVGPGSSWASNQARETG
jgi:hypothetical protein